MLQIQFLKSHLERHSQERQAEQGSYEEQNHSLNRPPLRSELSFDFHQPVGPLISSGATLAAISAGHPKTSPPRADVSSVNDLLEAVAVPQKLGVGLRGGPGGSSWVREDKLEDVRSSKHEDQGSSWQQRGGGRYRDEAGRFTFFGPSDAAFTAVVRDLASQSPPLQESPRIEQEGERGTDFVPTLLMKNGADNVDSLSSIIGTTGLTSGLSALGMLLRAAADDDEEGEEEKELSLSGQAGQERDTRIGPAPLQDSGSYGNGSWKEALDAASRALKMLE